MSTNFQLKLEEIIKVNLEKNIVPTLLLHSCCAPCSSYVLEYLSNYFKITIFYYNPNIYPKEEFDKRFNEQKRIIENLKTKYPIDLTEGEYEEDKFIEIARGLEKEVEGGLRCFKCYQLRLDETAKLALKLGYDYFTTTLSISPYKNAQKINEIGELLNNAYSVNYLYADFKKKNGYKRSIELSNEYNLYRQEYCGCLFSLENSKNNKGTN